VRAAAPWRDRIRRYKVMVDGRQLGTIGNGETVELSVSSGPHRVRLAISWTGSPELEVQVPDGGVATVRCSAKASSTAMIDLFSRTRWVDIEPDTSIA
jgi:hypothetical protein